MEDTMLNIARTYRFFSFRRRSWRIRFFLFSILIASCTTQQKIGKEAKADFFADKDFEPAHIGICVFDPVADKFLYNYQSEKLFIPASNTKLFTCYAGLKYLGDSIVAAKYVVNGDEVFIQATGDPTFLHPDFKRQPLYEFLKQDAIKTIKIYTPFASEPLGRGWAWDDYTEGYMAERDPFPMYGNIATVQLRGDTFATIPPSIKDLVAGSAETGSKWEVTRKLGGHFYSIVNDKGSNADTKTITMAMEKGSFAARYLKDTLHKEVTPVEIVEGAMQELHSQPTDSLFKIMMHRSDNFFAEQTLMMVSNKMLGEMNDYKITDTLLQTDYKDLPQKPKWVDGSGLSRYNLFSPQDFVWLLNKMRTEFKFERIKEILPTGGEGTLSSLYKDYAGRIYAKTGTLSNHVALSGFLLTKNNKTLIFSILVNNQQANTGNIRKAIEKFVSSMIERY